MVIVMGTVRIDPAAVEALRPAMQAMMAASRAEDGCLTYAYALDLLEPGLVRISETWTDRTALERMIGPAAITLPSDAFQMGIDPSTQHAFRTTRIGRIKSDGQFQIVWTAPEPIAPEPYPIERSAEEWRAKLNDLKRSWNGQWAAPND